MGNIYSLTIIKCIIGFWLVLILFGALTIITSYISLKSIKASSIISSKPVILVKDGIILNNNLLKLRVSIDELMMKLREKGTFNLEEVQYAIMEGDGQILGI